MEARARYDARNAEAATAADVIVGLEGDWEVVARCVRCRRTPVFCCLVKCTHRISCNNKFL